MNIIVSDYGREERVGLRRDFVLFVRIGCEVITTDHSSAGRAEDCRVARLSLGRWFDSGWSEFLSSCFFHQQAQHRNDKLDSFLAGKLTHNR
jgi:hypothetical protein